MDSQNGRGAKGMGHHNEEFKREAVRLFIERGERTVHEVAAQLGRVSKHAVPVEGAVSRSK